MSTSPPSAYEPEALLAHAGWLRRLGAHLVREGADLDDALQDTWAAALRSPPDAGRPARPWLGQVLRNFVRMRARGERRTRARLDEVAERAGEGPLPEAALERIQLQRVVAELVAGLAEPYRTTIAMRYFEDREPSAIAAALKIPAGTVRWRLKEGLDQLRARMDERLGGRRAWMAALMPATGPIVPSPWLKGALIMSNGKLMVASAVVLLVGVGVATKVRSGARAERATGEPTAAAREVSPGASALTSARSPGGAPLAAGAGTERAAPPRLQVAADAALTGTGLSASGAEQQDEEPAARLAGDLDPQQISSVIRERLGAIKDCYERLVLASDPKAGGRIEVRFKIAAKDGAGRITEADIAPPETDAEAPPLESPLLHQCMLNALADAKFPEPRGGGFVEVSYPFMFSASDEDDDEPPPPKRR